MKCAACHKRKKYLFLGRCLDCIDRLSSEANPWVSLPKKDYKAVLDSIEALGTEVARLRLDPSIHDILMGHVNDLRVAVGLMDRPPYRRSK